MYVRDALICIYTYSNVYIYSIRDALIRITLVRLAGRAEVHHRLRRLLKALSRPRHTLPYA